MRLELEPNQQQLAYANFVESDTAAESRAAESAQLLREGIKAAQSGNRAAARTSLLRAAELDPRSESAWLWLSSISEYPEELLAFLTNVLDINPSNARALEWSAATRTLLAKNFVQRGVDAAESGQAEMAVQHFNQALEYDERSSLAWLWLASLADSNEGRVNYFEKVLEFDPENDTALSGLQAARNSIREGLLKEARASAVAGRPEEANQLLDAVIAEEPNAEDAWILRSHLATDFESKAAAYRRVLEINPENAAARAGLDSISSILEAVGLPETSQTATSEEVTSASFSEAGPNGEAEHYDGTIIVNEIGGNDPVDGYFGLQQESFAPSAPDFADEAGASFPDVAPAAAPVEEAFSPDGEQREELTFELAPEAQVEEQMQENTPAYESSAVEVPDAPAVANNGHTFYNLSPLAVNTSNPFNSESFSNEPDQFKTLVSLDQDPEFLDAVQKYSPAAQDQKPSRPENDGFDAPFDATMYGGNVIPKPEAEFVEDPVATGGFETKVDLAPDEQRASAATSACAFCGHENDSQAISCNGCLAVLTLADLELILANHHADKALLRSAVETMERERSARELNESELTTLGIGHLNLRNLQFGYNYLQEASQKNPNNVVLSGQVNALLIRLDEIRRQDETHEAMSRGKTILVVDDSPTVRKLIAGKLEKCGHEVFCSNDGVEAMEMLANLRPDLILLDINMPRMDGYQVCKLIRGDESLKDVPVVMISGKDGFFDKVRGRMAGTSGYITKPFGPETLMKAVESYLRGEG